MTNNIIIGGRPCLQSCLDPIYGHVVVRLFLFDDVKNANTLLDSCVTRRRRRRAAPAAEEEEHASTSGDGPTEELNAASDSPSFCVLINPQLVVSPFHVLQSITRSLSTRDQNKMKTKSMETEVLYYLSPSKNITECLELFGINDATTQLLFGIVNEKQPVSDEQTSRLVDKIDGKPLELSQLEVIRDTERIRKLMGLTNEEASLTGGLESAMLSRVAIKGL
eukprot:GHVS01081540.1.p1 GENE.GHVS01081540.1~~GHVS01081540.1.p1  ORF type:complete len:222 (-),score=35.72 GHVS01081540.1:457-1122(-)